MQKCETQALAEAGPAGLLTFDGVDEWMAQRILIAEGRATWDDFSFEERTCKGFLLPYLYQIESMFAGRWMYWTRCVENGRPLVEPIPYIDFMDVPDPGAMKNLTDCLSAYHRHDFRLSDFLEWLLWGFGEGEQRPRISVEANEFLYRTFNLGPLLQHPHDYLGHILSEQKQGYWNNPNAFYPTPHAVCDMMVQMQFIDADREGVDLKDKKVCDPCVGTGRMLMYASNHSLFLYGADIDYVCVMATKVNGFLYVPWMVRPGLPEPEGPDDAVADTRPRIEVKAGADGRPRKPLQLELFN